MKRRSKVDCTWTADFAYVIGLMTSDGNLSSDGRHLNLTSKDIEIVLTAKHILGLENKIGTKARDRSKEKKYYVLQFGDKNFYEFLLSIGLTPAKSKTIRFVHVPKEFFRDFLRGCIDGDGSIDSFMHPESLHRQIRVRLCSASPLFLAWMLNTIRELCTVEGGYIMQQKNKGVGVLAFAKADSLILLDFMYYTDSVPALARKRVVAEELRASGGIGIRA